MDPWLPAVIATSAISQPPFNGALPLTDSVWNRRLVAHMTTGPKEAATLVTLSPGPGLSPHYPRRSTRLAGKAWSAEPTSKKRPLATHNTLRTLHMLSGRHGAHAHTMIVALVF